MATKEEAKKALDKVIEKSRIHLYKPIQIAEILYRARMDNSIDLLDLEQYRTKSKRWRDEISLPLLGRVCTSSAKFQDNLFDENAIPPILLNALGKENVRTGGAVEAYIYNLFFAKHSQLSMALDYCTKSTSADFFVKKFIDLFWNEPGLRRSLDKIYEIIVYSLFSTIVEAVHFKVTLSIDAEKMGILEEFDDFASKVMCIDSRNTAFVQDAKMYRVGVTNAADRGLDMYSNWGPAIQIKHLSLDVELAENIVSGISSDRIVIVCKDAEKNTIFSLLSQIGWRSRIQSIVTESDLINWYEKALRGVYASEIGNRLLDVLKYEIAEEFPSVNSFPSVLKERHYERIKDDFWK
nr:HaeII family restriction endonuclease [Treponema sp.]